MKTGSSDATNKYEGVYGHKQLTMSALSPGKGGVDS